MNLRRPAIVALSLLSQIATASYAAAGIDPVRPKPQPVTDGNNLEGLAKTLLLYMRGEDHAGLTPYMIKIENAAAQPAACEGTLLTLMQWKNNREILVDKKKLPVATFNTGDPNVDLQVYDRYFFETEIPNDCKTGPVEFAAHPGDGDDAVATSVTVFNLWHSDTSPNHKVTGDYINQITKDTRYPVNCANTLLSIVGYAENPSAEIAYANGKPVIIGVRKDGVGIGLDKLQKNNSCVSGPDQTSPLSKSLAEGFVSKIEGQVRDALVAEQNASMAGENSVPNLGLKYVSGPHLNPDAEKFFNKYWTTETQGEASQQCKNELHQFANSIASVQVGRPLEQQGAIFDILKAELAERTFAGLCPAAPAGMILLVP